VTGSCIGPAGSEHKGAGGTSGTTLRFSGAEILGRQVVQRHGIANSSLKNWNLTLLGF
jgi:hypothetical protein